MKINLIEYFVETVGRFGERVAVVDGDRRVTFNELDVQARKTGPDMPALSAGWSRVT